MASQGFVSNHWSGSSGMPTGGSTYGIGFAISWQNGPLGRGEERNEPNGAFVEDVILAAKDRLDYYQSTRFACDENALAIQCLIDAIGELRSRTAKREARGVEGTHGE